jgi:hypothetical protein
MGGKSHCITPLGLYRASRVSGHGPAGLGNSKLLVLPTGQTQTHGWGIDSEGHGPSRGRKAKHPGAGGAWAAGGRENACRGVNEDAGWWSSCRNAKGRGWNRCREPRVTCNRKALITASRDVGGSRRKGRSAAEKRRDGRWNRCRDPRVSCDLRIGGP